MFSLRKNSSFGFDISNGTLRFVELVKDGDSIKIGRYGTEEMTDEVIEDLEEIDSFLKIWKRSKKLWGVSIPRAQDILNLREETISKAVIPYNDPQTYMILDLNPAHASVVVTSMNVPLFIASFTADGVSRESLKDKISKHLLSWHLGKDKEDRQNPSVKKIIICGSGEDLHDLAEYLSVNLRTKAELADVWINLGEKKNIPEITFNQSI